MSIYKRGGLILVAALLLSASQMAVAAAQSGRKPRSATSPPVQENTPAQASSVAAENLENVKLILSYGFERFVEDLNENGRLGYRLEKSLSYGGAGVQQSFAAVLRLDPGNAYEYDWLSSPRIDLLEPRLNSQAKRGFNFANAFPLAICEDERDPEPDTTGLTLSVVRELMGNSYLIERPRGNTVQTREYRIVRGNAGPFTSTKKAIETALASAPPGFRPVKLIFSKEGLFDFSIAVLLEKNLTEGDAPKVEYRLVKEIRGFDKALNALAAQGFRFVAGGHVGSIHFALMGMQTKGATVYTYFDDEDHSKKFDKTVAQGKRYHALISGEMNCESLAVDNQKLLFAQAPGGTTAEYKVLKVPKERTIKPVADSLADFQSLTAAGYQVRDIFYSDGLHVIFEK